MFLISKRFACTRTPLESRRLPGHSPRIPSGPARVPRKLSVRGWAADQTPLKEVRVLVEIFEHCFCKQSTPGTLDIPFSGLVLPTVVVLRRSKVDVLKSVLLLRTSPSKKTQHFRVSILLAGT